MLHHLLPRPFFPSSPAPSHDRIEALLDRNFAAISMLLSQILTAIEKLPHNPELRDLIRRNA